MTASAVALHGEHCAAKVGYGPPVAGGPYGSDFDGFGDGQRVFDLDTEISDRAIHLGMSQEELHRSQIARLSVDLRNFRPAHRVGPIGTRLQPDRRHPVAHQAGILAGGDVRHYGANSPNKVIYSGQI
jgi:hypothetical protein